MTVHGAGSRKENHRDFSELASKAGFAALALDLRGHGDSEGAPDAGMLDDVLTALDHLASLGYTPLGIRGSSLGGFLALHAAARHPGVVAVVAICPAQADSLARLFSANWPSRWPIGQAVTAPGIARGFWHATGDEKVPWQTSFALSQLAPQPRHLRVVMRGHHRSLQHDPVVLADTVEFLREHLLDDGERIAAGDRDMTPNTRPHGLEALEREVVACRACPRLVEWRECVGHEKRASFADWHYWAKPVPGFGDPDPWLFVAGLAPAAHGANRTGRVFTGDRSGDFLFAALHRAGLASQAESTHAGDGLTLTGCRIAAAVRCAPPANKPTPAERDACLSFFRRELELCPGVQVVLALGALAWDATLRATGVPRPWPKFAHGAEAPLGEATLLGSYHVSQQNTFTGRLTPAMFDAVLERARELAGEGE